MVKYCSNCGAPVHEGDKFCSDCGERVADDGAGGQSQQTGDRSGQRRDDGGGPAGRTVGGRSRSQPTDRTGSSAWEGDRTGGWDSGGEEPITGLPRRDAISTFREAVDWLTGFPVLIGAFLVVELVSAVGQASFLFQLLGFALSLLVGGVAYLYVERLVRERQQGVSSGEMFGGGADDFSDALSDVAGQFLSLLGIFIVYVLAVGIGLVLLILPGIYLGARLRLAFPACVIDKKGAVESLETSWEVAEGNVLKLVGIFLVQLFALFLGGVAVAVLTLALGGFDALDEPTVQFLITPLAAFLTGAVEMAFARVYLENRAIQTRSRPRPASADEQSRSRPSQAGGRYQEESTDWGTDDQSSGWDENSSGWDDQSSGWDEESSGWETDDDSGDWGTDDDSGW